MMHGPLPDQQDQSDAATGNPLVAALGRVLTLCNGVIVVFAALALIAACVILSYSVLGRALFHSPNYWQDEAAISASRPLSGCCRRSPTVSGCG